jgi:hypothetical protein
MRAIFIFFALALGGCSVVDPVVRASEESVGPFNGGFWAWLVSIRPISLKTALNSGEV